MTLKDCLTNIKGHERIRVIDYDHFLCSSIDQDFALIHDGKCFDFPQQVSLLSLNVREITVVDGVLQIGVCSRINNI